MHATYSTNDGGGPSLADRRHDRSGGPRRSSVPLENATEPRIASFDGRLLPPTVPAGAASSDTCVFRFHGKRLASRYPASVSTDKFSRRNTHDQASRY
jgi:hypothetical protein